MEVRSDRTYRLAAPPDAVWATLARVQDYRSWWPWLRRMDAEGLIAGDRWKCVVGRPCPTRSASRSSCSRWRRAGGSRRR